MEVSVSTPLEPVVPTFPVHRFSADRYVEMIHAGILTEDDKVELIDGVIVEMAPAGNEHTWETIRLTDLFAPALPTHYLVIQGTVRVTDVDMFDPDLALVRRRGDEQLQQHPHAKDIDLVIEVAKSSIKTDQTKKASAYAKAKIVEYWIVDLNSKTVIVHRAPNPDGYQDIRTHGAEVELTPHEFPKIKVRVGDVFGG